VARTFAALTDVLPIVEAAYAIDATLRAWVQRLLDAAEVSVGEGLGGFACVFRASGNGTLAVDRSSAAVLPRSTAALDAIFDGLTHAPCGWLSSYLRGGGELARWLITSEADPACQLFYRRHLGWSGVHDGLNLVCMDLDQRGVLLSLGIRANAPLDAATRTRLARVATHILAAFRLRMRLGDEGTLAQPEPTPRTSDNFLASPDGEVANADDEVTLARARRALQTAVKEVARARAALRSDMQRALEISSGLVAAQWTLVDQYESDGKRFVVAQENAPQARGLAQLTPTERSVVTCAARGLSTKEVAYTLGISDATVRVLLMRAARRCGVDSRAALLALGRQAMNETRHPPK
jgi:DNA-binding CsgD family transcriptional regulator